MLDDVKFLNVTTNGVRRYIHSYILTNRIRRHIPQHTLFAVSTDSAELMRSVSRCAVLILIAWNYSDIYILRRQSYLQIVLE